MTKDSSDTNITSTKISGTERNQAGLAYFTTFLIPLLPIAFGILFSSADGDFPLWIIFLYPVGGAVGALICGLIYWGNMRISQFVSNHSSKAAKINIVCTIALILIILLFFNAFDGPEGLVPGLLTIPFVCGGPVVGMTAVISIYSQNKHL